MPRQTSRDAFRSLPDINGKQREVFVAIKEMGSACNIDIADHLGLPINRVTPRTNELVKMGKVKEGFRAICPKTNRKAIYWKAVVTQGGVA